VLVCGIVTVPLTVLGAVIEPLAMLLALVPLCVLLPLFSWLDRVEPEPRASRLHAILWGATVAALVSSIVNDLVAFGASMSVAVVISAPLVEETMKGLGVLWAVRRRELDGVMDGIVYAGWVALGFALVENLLYFSQARDDGTLAGVFVARAVFMPFSHPMFTVWTGLAVGRAVAANRRVFPAVLAGWVPAVLTHAAWNGLITLGSESDRGEIALLVFVGVFPLLFLIDVVIVLRVRSAERRRFLAMVPMLAARYGLRPADVAVYCNWRVLLATRRALPRPRRRSFDRVHRALARLAAWHGRSGTADPVDEQRLTHQLEEAWATARPAGPDAGR